MIIKRSTRAAWAGAAGLFALAAPAIVGAAPSPPLAPGVQAAPDFTPTRTPYVVTNPTPLYRNPAYGTDNTTGETLGRGTRPEILGEANAGLYLLVGREGRGVGYAPRSLLCPVALCPTVKP